MIELIVYPKGDCEKLINPSPFCSKTEILLRLLKIDYKVKEFQGNPAIFPNKKLPVIKYHSQLIHDSSLIQDHLIEKFARDLDAHLDAALKAQGHAFVKMLEEFFYWSLLHERWFIDENWEKLKKSYFGHIPLLMRGFITKMVRKSTQKSAIGHGMSRHCDQQVLKFGKDSLQALSDFLEGKNFLLGEKISSYDITVYAFVSSVLHSDLNPELRQQAESLENLRNYDQRLFAHIF